MNAGISASDLVHLGMLPPEARYLLRQDGSVPARLPVHVPARRQAKVCCLQAERLIPEATGRCDSQDTRENPPGGPKLLRGYDIGTGEE